MSLQPIHSFIQRLNMCDCVYSVEPLVCWCHREILEMESIVIKSLHQRYNPFKIVSNFSCCLCVIIHYFLSTVDMVSGNVMFLCDGCFVVYTMHRI